MSARRTNGASSIRENHRCGEVRSWIRFREASNPISHALIGEMYVGTPAA